MNFVVRDAGVLSIIFYKTLGGTNFTKPIGNFTGDLEQTLVTPASTPPHRPPETPLGAIMGGTIGGVAFALLILCGFLVCRKRREALADRVDRDTRRRSQTEMGDEQDWIQSPVSSVSELLNSIYQYPSPVQGLPERVWSRGGGF